ncbi:HEPN domain-containing protein [uncultured Methanobrevibacter sp.]|uniref:HEPN domain-containing protein n=1 Tax=uncultured Methanobrevibacter sp. TaxID=253161 RepID=UPI0025F3E137|nr:HEPN domain-containing protein [uncultured Methanobrevibacter sp.]
MFDEIFGKLGTFWVSDNDKKIVSGQINQNNNDFEISFVNVDFDVYDDDYILLNGIVENKKLSLIIINDPIKFTHAKVINNTYYIKYLFEGIHYNNKDNIKFENINIKIDNILSTINLRSFSTITPKPDILLIKKPTNDYSVDLNEFILEIFLKPRSTIGYSSNGQYAKFNEEIILKLNYDCPRSIDEIYPHILKIKDLFTFLTGKSEIIGLYESSECMEINMFFPIVTSTYNMKPQHYALIQLNENNLEKIFNNWFENYGSLNGVYDLYFSTIGSNLSSETLFLTYCQILESYHRKKYLGEYVSKEKFEDFKSKFTPCATKMEGLDEIVSKENKSQFLNKILNSIQFCYEFTLKDRLKEIFNEFKRCDLFIKIIDKFTDEETFDKGIKTYCDIIKDGRNYYTHYGEEPENLLKGIEFLELTDSLNLIIKMIFLKEFGLTDSEINNITVNPRFKFVEYYED